MSCPLLPREQSKLKARKQRRKPGEQSARAPQGAGKSNGSNLCSPRRREDGGMWPKMVKGGSSASDGERGASSVRYRCRGSARSVFNHGRRRIMRDGNGSSRIESSDTVATWCPAGEG